MSVATYSAAAALAGVLGVAGLLKLHNPRHVPLLMSRFVESSGSRQRVMRASGIAELFTAIVLLIAPATWVALVASASICVAFTAIAIHQLIVDDDSDCGCFGSMELMPVPPWIQLFRSAVLLITPAVLGWALHAELQIQPSLDGLFVGGLIALMWFLVFVVAVRVVRVVRSWPAVGTRG